MEPVEGKGRRSHLRCRITRETPSNLITKTWEPRLLLGRGGRSTLVDKAGVGTMSQLKIRIETDEYIYEEYIEA